MSFLGKGKRKQLRIDYDEKEGSFFVGDPNLESWSSIPFGDIILDITKDGKISGFEVLGCEKLNVDLDAHEKMIRELEEHERKESRKTDSG